MEDKKKLHILWTNADPHTSEFMVMMYATNSLLKGWWDEVTVIIWGATARYVAGDTSIQEKMRLAANVGVRFSACVACARQLGVEDALAALDVEIMPWGQPLTELLQGEQPLITI